MCIDVLEDYPAGNRMQVLFVSLCKDNITASGCFLKEKQNRSGAGNDLYLHMCGGLQKKYCHLDGNNLVVPPFTLGSRRPSPGFTTYCDGYQPTFGYQHNVSPDFQVNILYHLVRAVSHGDEIAICICKRTFYFSSEN